MPQEREWAEFLDRMIHDLREPLRSVHAFSELLRETAGDKLGPEGETEVSEILSAATRMRVLADGLSGYALALREADAPGAAGFVAVGFRAGVGRAEQADPGVRRGCYRGGIAASRFGPG